MITLMVLIGVQPRYYIHMIHMILMYDTIFVVHNIIRVNYTGGARS